jgi:molecular chaperone GrpE
MTKKKAKKSSHHPKSEEKPSVEKPETDITVEEEESAAEVVEQAPAEEPSLEEQLEEARKKADENWNLLLRSKAELENMHKRVKRDVESAHKFGLEKMASELLAVRDSMELGLGAAQESTDVQSLLEGAELTLKMLTQVMEKFGIQQVNPEREKFNPELHQAMTLQESDELEPNTVITVMQKGYTLNDRLLRPALVTVSKAPATDK